MRCPTAEMTFAHGELQIWAEAFAAACWHAPGPSPGGARGGAHIQNDLLHLVQQMH